VFRYTPEKDEWRRFVSPTCPGPRSAHAVAVSPAGGGKIFLFGTIFLLFDLFPSFSKYNRWRILVSASKYFSSLS
jgi:hypothetical protein